jgi:hypothetical protein
VPRVLRLFSGFYGIIFAELQIDPQLESTIRPKARGLHSIWYVILQITFSIWFLLQDSVSTIEDLQEKNSRTLGNYSRRLQDYSRISWSTFQPRDASSIFEDFRLVVCWEFRKTRHPRNVEFNKVLEACFSGAGNSRFLEAWNM